MGGQSLSWSRSYCFLWLLARIFLFLISALWNKSNNGWVGCCSRLGYVRALVDTANLRNLTIFQWLLMSIHHIEIIITWIARSYTKCSLTILALSKDILLMLLICTCHRVRRVPFWIPKILCQNVLKSGLLFITVFLLLGSLILLLSIGWTQEIVARKLMSLVELTFCIHLGRRVSATAWTRLADWMVKIHLLVGSNFGAHCLSLLEGWVWIKLAILSIVWP